MLDQTEAVEARAIVAHRQTGQLKTVNASEVEALGSVWMFVCREPDELVGLETDSGVREPECALLHHRHDHGNPVDGCPVLRICDHKAFEMPAAAYWTAEDLSRLHDVIVRWLEDDGAIWSIDVEQKYGKWVTTIEVSTFHSMAKKGPRGRLPHEVKLEYTGVPNAATLTWFARQGTRYHLSVAIGPQTTLPQIDRKRVGVKNAGTGWNPCRPDKRLTRTSRRLMFSRHVRNADHERRDHFASRDRFVFGKRSMTTAQDQESPAFAATLAIRRECPKTGTRL